MTTVLFRESISVCKVPETPDLEKSIYKIPEGGRPEDAMPINTQDEDNKKSSTDISGDDKNKKKKQDGDQLSDSDEDI